MTDETRQQIEKYIGELDAFLKSGYYLRVFLPGVAQDIDDTERSILLNMPVGPEAQSRDYLMRGELGKLQNDLKYFEEARAHLKAKLDVKVESESESTTTHI